MICYYSRWSNRISLPTRTSKNGQNIINISFTGHGIVKSNDPWVRVSKLVKTSVCLSSLPGKSSQTTWKSGESREKLGGLPGLKSPIWVIEPKAVWVVGHSTEEERAAQRSAKGICRGYSSILHLCTDQLMPVMKLLEGGKTLPKMSKGNNPWCFPLALK